MKWNLGLSREYLERDIQRHEQERLRQLGYVDHYNNLAADKEAQGKEKLAAMALRSASICMKHVESHTERIREIRVAIYKAQQ